MELNSVSNLETYLLKFSKETREIVVQVLVDCL